MLRKYQQLEMATAQVLHLILRAANFQKMFFLLFFKFFNRSPLHNTISVFLFNVKSFQTCKITSSGNAVHTKFYE